MAFGTSDWTIELWAYYTTDPTAGSGDSTFGNFTTYGTNTSVLIYKNTYYVSSTGSSPDIASGVSMGTFPVNSWVHLAIVRNGTTITPYVNGVAGTTSSVGATTSIYYPASDTTFIGCDQGASGNHHMQGYISDFRQTNGTAVYTSNFTPPTSPLSSSGASLHIKGTDASIIDKAQKSNLILAGNTTGSTTQVKFAGTKSMYFDGTGDYINLTQDPGLGANDWTFETWVYLPNLSSDFVLLSQGPGNNSSVSGLRITTDGKLAFQTYLSSNKVLWSSNVAITAGNWHHIAITHDYNGSTGGTYKVYVDGSEIGVSSGSYSYGSSYFWNYSSISGSTFSIARYNYNNTTTSNGYLQDTRITKGLIRYTSNFTPPTAELQG